ADTGELTDFLETASDLFSVAFWERFAGNRYLGVKLDDQPWRYFNVMGQMGESFGLVYFETWLELCALIHDQPSMIDMMNLLDEGGPSATQRQEAVSTIPLNNLHPDDLRALEAVDGVARFYTEAQPPEDTSLASLLADLDLDGLDLGSMGLELPDGMTLEGLTSAREHGGTPAPSLEVPLPAQLSMQGPAPARFPLTSYTLVLKALGQILAKRRAKVITSIKQRLELGGHTLTLRYPAKGDEAFNALTKTSQPDLIPGTYRLTVDLAPSSADGKGDDDYGYDYEYSKIVIEASGDASAQQLMKALDKSLKYEGGFGGFAVDDDPQVDVASLTDGQAKGANTSQEGTALPEVIGPASSPQEAIAMLLARREGTASMRQIWSRRETYGPKAFVAQLAELAEQQPMFLSKWLSYYPLSFERISDDTRPKDDPVQVSLVK
ncbi:MAG: hypothetical protein AAF708_00685, partial [Deinococcota bacterium]